MTVQVRLILGSGGARGLAHIGVIEWLQENGFEIRSIAGSSMGALIGGIYAAGELQTYKNWVTALEKKDVLSMLDLSFSSTGLFWSRPRTTANVRRWVGPARRAPGPRSRSAT